MKRILLLPALIFLLQSCRQTKDCPALDAKYMALINYSQGQVITFVNSSGDEINFTVNNKTVSDPYTTRCESGGLILGGDCSRTTCKASASLNAVSDSSRNGNNALSININFSSFSYRINTSMAISLLDYYYVIPLDPFQRSQLFGDTTFDHLTLGSHSYDSVMTVSTDSSSSNQKIWRIYFTNNQGVIAFADRQTNSIFYLK